MYGLNAARQARRSGSGAIHLGEYRKMRPGPIEEFVSSITPAAITGFIGRCSGRRRIFGCMRSDVRK